MAPQPDKVVLQDLETLGKAFSDLEGDLSQGLQANDVPVPNMGDGDLDKVLVSVDSQLVKLSDGVKEKIRVHSDKLQHAHKSYKQQDINNRGLYDDLNDE